MSNCIFLGDHNSFLIKAENEEELEAGMQDWVDDYKQYMEQRTNAYVEAYRTTLDIPMDVTLEEERDIVIGRFGKSPMDNEEFVELTRESEKLYEKLRPETPDWASWFNEKGFDTVDVTHILDCRGDV